jgi:hypothetical protein
MHSDALPALASRAMTDDAASEYGSGVVLDVGCALGFCSCHQLDDCLRLQGWSAALGMHHACARARPLGALT